MTEQLEFELTKARKQLEREQKSSGEKAKENKANLEQLEGTLIRFVTFIKFLSVYAAVHF